MKCVDQKKIFKIQFKVLKILSTSCRVRYFMISFIKRKDKLLILLRHVSIVTLTDFSHTGIWENLRGNILRIMWQTLVPQ